MPNEARGTMRAEGAGRAETLWTCVATCRHCGHELNRAEHVPESKKAMVARAAPLAVGVCPVRAHNTFSDITFAPVLTWIPES